MAQRLFTGQYGPLSQVDTRPIIAAGQAWGQAIQGTLENVGKAIEKHRLNKEWEQTEPEVRSLMESQGMPADEIEVALKAAKSYGAKAGPEAYRMAREFAQQQQQAESIRLNQESLRQTMEARKEQQLAQTISDLEQSASYYMSQGREVPESIREALYRHNLNRGGSLEASAGRIMQGSQNIKQSQEVQDLEKRNIESLISSRDITTEATKTSTTINKAKQLLYMLSPRELASPFATRTFDGYTPQEVTMAKGMYQMEMVKALKDNPSPAVGKQITDIDSQREKLLKTSYRIDNKGKRATLEQILADPKLMNKRMENDNLNRDLIAYDALSSKISDLAGTTPETRTFTDPQTGQARTATKTVSEWMQIDAEKERRAAQNKADVLKEQTAGLKPSQLRAEQNARQRQLAKERAEQYARQRQLEIQLMQQSRIRRN